MKFEIWAIGKCAHSYLQNGIELYCKKLKHYIPVEYVEWPESKAARTADKEKSLKLQADYILSKITSEDYLILLDEQGAPFTSKQFASQINKWMLQSSKRIIFLIGGAFGFHPSIYDRSKAKISLSNMTFSHDMVRLILLEQVYRACTILKNEPYHHD